MRKLGLENVDQSIKSIHKFKKEPNFFISVFLVRPIGWNDPHIEFGRIDCNIRRVDEIVERGVGGEIDNNRLVVKTR